MGTRDEGRTAFGSGVFEFEKVECDAARGLEEFPLFSSYRAFQLDETARFAIRCDTTRDR